MKNQSVIFLLLSAVLVSALPSCRKVTGDGPVQDW
jgi:hypothetical protein